MNDQTLFKNEDNSDVEVQFESDDEEYYEEDEEVSFESTVVRKKFDPEYFKDLLDEAKASLTFNIGAWEYCDLDIGKKIVEEAQLLITDD